MASNPAGCPAPPTARRITSDWGSSSVRTPRTNLAPSGVIKTTCMRTLPDVSLVRERSSPAIYLVVGDTRFWVIDPAEFDALGFRWDKVNVLDDGTLVNLYESRLHAPPAIRPSDVFFDCGNDFDSVTGRWHFNCHTSTSIVRRDVLVAGWLEARNGEPSAPFVNRGEHGIEDIFYNIVLDSRFVDRMYGPEGLSQALLGATYPGNPASGAPVPFASQPPDASNTTPRLTFDSWVLPHQGWNLHVELNAWHRDNTGALFGRHFVGRGPAPDFWVNPFPDDPGAFFPFNPFNPDGRGALRAGDYILMRGTLWQDGVHYGGPNEPRLPFDSGQFSGQGGWLEMHPPDWVAKVGSAPGGNARETCKWIALITADRTGGGESLVDAIGPDFAPASSTRFLEVRDVKVTTDQRFTLPVSVRALSAVDRTDHVDITATTAPTGFAKGRLKCSWVVGWRERDRADRIWVNDALPAGAVVGADRESWTWVTGSPKPFIGALAHRSALVPNEPHQHYFSHATDTLPVGSRDVLFAMIYLDPINPPDQVMLQWQTSGWEHRAYWGESQIGWGIEGTVSRRRLGPLPRSGEWVRLEVPAADVGLAGITVRGMAFTLCGGLATWDYAGVRVVEPKLTVSVQPTSVELHDDAEVTVRAVDAVDGHLVNGTVSAGAGVIGNTNAPFNLFFSTLGRVELVVSCPGYSSTKVGINVKRPPRDT